MDIEKGGAHQSMAKKKSIEGIRPEVAPCGQHRLVLEWCDEGETDTVTDIELILEGAESGRYPKVPIMPARDGGRKRREAKVPVERMHGGTLEEDSVGLGIHEVDQVRVT
ncbi:hypothetical protein GUJ93_ZPchr0002g26471 [Zizania palustris]|uniref:Uncharacterized protein n=1 Tax=Zizania palustris TaxID=103762 RepID=A0A8J5S5R8_ZIZPA|nr:hypothetical protein GUJ93_ZPchr0002g26471 [Zizania palustris]